MHTRKNMRFVCFLGDRCRWPGPRTVSSMPRPTEASTREATFPEEGPWGRAQHASWRPSPSWWKLPRPPSVSRPMDGFSSSLWGERRKRVKRLRSRTQLWPFSTHSEPQFLWLMAIYILVGVEGERPIRSVDRRNSGQRFLRMYVPYRPTRQLVWLYGTTYRQRVLCV